MDYSIALNDAELEALSQVQNMPFRLYVLTKRMAFSGLSVSYQAIARYIIRDNFNPNYTNGKRPNRHEFRIAYHTLWRNDIVNLSIDNHHVIVTFPLDYRIGGIAIRDIGTRWVELGKDVKPNRDPLPKWLRSKVFEKQGRRCRLCGTTDNLTIDHIRAVAIGGSNELSNLQVLCRSCNSKKHTKEVLYIVNG